MEKKLKILCIHGYRQTGQVFRQRTGAFRKALKKIADFEFVTAPNEIKTDNPDDEQVFGWWFSSPDNTYKAQDYTECSNGFEHSLTTVASALEKQGPFDGVLAFSQGASLLSVICGLKEQGDERFQGFRFAMFVSGFKSRQAAHQEFYKTQISLPTLHVMGETDQVIEKEMSEDLATLYGNKTVVCHKGGHFVPATSAEKSQYISFLKEFM